MLHQTFWGNIRTDAVLAAVDGEPFTEVACKVCGFRFVLDHEIDWTDVCRCLGGKADPLPLPILAEPLRPKLAHNDSLRIKSDFRIHRMLTPIEAVGTGPGIGNRSLLHSGYGDHPCLVYMKRYCGGWWHVDQGESTADESSKKLRTWDRISVHRYEFEEGITSGWVAKLLPDDRVIFGSVTLMW